MKEKEANSKQKRQEPYRVRLPGFISDEDVGLGDAIKRVTSNFGIKPCGGCERRADRAVRAGTPVRAEVPAGESTVRRFCIGLIRLYQRTSRFRPAAATFLGRETHVKKSTRIKPRRRVNKSRNFG